MRGRRRHLHETPGGRSEDSARCQDLPRLPPPAGRQEHRRGADRDPAAPALGALRGLARGRQARLPGKDHGVHRGARQEDARGLAAGGQTHRPDRAPGGFERATSRRRQFSEARADGQNYGHSRAHVPQHAAREAAVGQARVSGHDGGKHRLEIVPGRCAGARFRCQPVHQLALLLGLLRRQRAREHVPPARVLVQGAGTEDPQGGHHDRRGLLVERRPGSPRHHERRHGTRRGDSVFLGFRFRQRPVEGERGRAGRKRHHFPEPADPLYAAKGEPARRQRNDGRHPQRAARPYAEFPGLHPLRPGAELPVRAGVPRFHRLPHGGGELPATANRALGCRQGRDGLTRRGRNLKAEIGIIGGSGLYGMPGFETREEAAIETPFGWPSDNYVVGTLAGRQVAFLARHGRGHRISPSELNFRANIYGMKSLGVERIISLSAVGSLKEEHRPLDFVVPDQFFDRTRGRVSTFFGEGLVAHIGFADPVCPELSEVVTAAGRAAGVNVKKGGTYLCMEGPAFSTKAESNVYRSWGMDVIGMTNLQEAKLAREAETCYATVAMVTDYDCWHTEHDAVTVQQVIDTLNRNVENAQKIIRSAMRAMPRERTCKCGSALAHAILTDRKKVTPAVKRKLALLVGKYF